MTLVANWRRVLSRAWSIRFLAAAFLFSVLEIVLPALDGFLPVPPLTFAVVSGLCSAAAFVARLVAQSSVSGAQS